MARAAGGQSAVAGCPRPGHEPLRHRPGRFSEELLQRIGSLRRLIEVMVGERLSAERRSSLDHALASYYAQRRERTGFRDFYAFLEGETPEIAHLLRPFATGSLRDLLSDEGDDLLAREALVTVFDLHLLEPELRPAAAMVCTETVWAAAAQDPRPRLLVVDEVCSIMQHPEGARPSWCRWRNAPASTGWGCSSSPRTCRTSSPRTPQEPSPDTVRSRPAPERRLQAALAAGRRRRQHRGRSLRPARGTATLAACLVLVRRWSACWREANRFPVRIEATPEETEVIEWRPGPQALNPTKSKYRQRQPL